jgi:hypothetical protein
MGCTTSYTSYRKPSGKAPVMHPGDESPCLVSGWERVGPSHCCVRRTQRREGKLVRLERRFYCTGRWGTIHMRKHHQQTPNQQTEEKRKPTPTLLLEVPLRVTWAFATE